MKGSSKLMDRLPLEGIRVADFGWVLAVPHATAWLGAFGAEVIKVETSLAPDLTRTLNGTGGIPGLNRCGYFNSLNFSKKSLSLNLRDPKGGEIARRLIKQCDIVTENFSAGVMKKFGLDYDSLRAIRPDLIMLSGTPLGQTGPLSYTLGWGPTTQAFAGMCHLSGYPGAYPSGIGANWPDFEVGVAMAFALAAAIYHRERTGEGQFIDFAMGELVTAMLPEAMLDFFINGIDRGPIGNRHEAMAPHGVFPAAGDDQWIALAILDDREFKILCEELGAPELAADSRYETLAVRLENAAMLEAEIASLTRDYDRDEMVRRLRARNLAAGPVYNTAELMKDPAFIESGTLVALEHGEVGRREIAGLPVKMSRTQPEYRPAPLLGEHNETILRDLLGYSESEIVQFFKEKVLI
ncbi:MAG: CaiB/BaiF CoA transferase family protein [Candidatus Binataceae bacterium]